MSLDHFSLKWEVEPRYAIGPQDLSKAVRHLYRAIDHLGGCRKCVQKGFYDIFFSQSLADSWTEVNRCRGYTEGIGLIDNALVPAMSEILNAKSTFDSLVSSNLGMTRHGLTSIVRSIRGAEFGIRPCIRELESWQKL